MSYSRETGAAWGVGSAGWLVQAVSRSGAASKAASARFMVGLSVLGVGLGWGDLIAVDI